MSIYQNRLQRRFHSVGNVSEQGRQLTCDNGVIQSSLPPVNSFLPCRGPNNQLHIQINYNISMRRLPQMYR